MARRSVPPNDDRPLQKFDQQLHLYSIRISGHLGPTALSAFPSMVSQLKGEDALLTSAY
jgi:hypothetical protein